MEHHKPHSIHSIQYSLHFLPFQIWAKWNKQKSTFFSHSILKISEVCNDNFYFPLHSLLDIHP